MSQGPDLRGYIPDITKLGLPYVAQTTDTVQEEIYSQEIVNDSVYVVEGTIGAISTTNADFFSASFQLAVKLDTGIAKIVTESTPFKGRSDNTIDLVYSVAGTILTIYVKGKNGTTMNWSGTIKVNSANN